MTAAIWSTKPNSCTLHFPAITLIRFMYNHHLLQISSRPSWLTLRHGAKEYVDKVIGTTKNKYLRTPVTKIVRKNILSQGNGNTGKTDLRKTTDDGKIMDQDQKGKVILTSSRGDEEFDHVIFAIHADDSLRILGDQSSELERDVLSSFEFSKNIACLHSDLNVPSKQDPQNSTL